jgi:hypothetical protein
MIPAFVPDDAPPGEKVIFERLKHCPADWVAIHSLDLAPWNGHRRTELDFLVIIPSHGILCLEVKSHSDIAYEDGSWFPPTLKAGPFKQALNARYSFRRRLVKLLPGCTDVPVVHCCAFPFAPFDIPAGISVHRTEYMDSRDIARAIARGALGLELLSRVADLIAVDPDLKPLRAPLPPAKVDEIVRLCIPVRLRRPEWRVEQSEREAEMDRLLRDQQKPVLNLTEQNRRVLVEGGAGTGKTLVAIEVARRAAMRGKRVALVCFNALVGEWMKSQVLVDQQHPHLVIERAYRLLSHRLGIDIPPNPDSRFWDVELLALAEQRLTDPEYEASGAFDFMVIDEAQDILARPRLFDCLMALLEGGADQGAFALFGDFDHQVLTNRDVLAETLRRAGGAKDTAKWRLDENCRNVKIVAETALKLSGFPPDVYSAYVRGSGRPSDIDFDTYSDSAQQEKLIQEVVRKFVNRGYRPRDITLVSCCAARSSAGARLADVGWSVGPAGTLSDRITYASVHAFKGMENRVIVITDAALTDGLAQRDVFYTAMTRSTDSVHVLIHERSAGILQSWLKGTE